MTLIGNIRIAIDIGGTFTDVQVLEESSGRSFSLKTPTTPHDPSQGLLTGIESASETFGFAKSQIHTLMHGTTIATNAVLERKLPRGALITTAGFEDVLEIGRHVRRNVYAPVAEYRPVLIERRLRIGVTERTRNDGAIETPLGLDCLDGICSLVEREKIETLAICLLHSYANPAHEIELAAALAARLPDVTISTSHTVSPELREFERTSTTVLNALLMPVVGAYLSKLEATLRGAEINASLYLFQSNGGVMPASRAANQPVRLLLSGPAGGALGAASVGTSNKLDDLVGIDMGGTSFDVCVIHNATVREVGQGEVADLPVRVPMSDIRTISAGGGSIAAVSSSGALSVGPHSAGAVPGPACYGQGGTEATVTDANIATGRLSAERFLAGTMDIDAKAARDTVDAKVAKPLRLTAEQAAAGILRVAVVEMAAAIRLSLFEKGLDPRDFALTAFGGAGGLHAAEVAEELGATTVLYPVDAATLSAWGMLYADVIHDLAATQLWPAHPTAGADIQTLTDRLVRQGHDLLHRDGFEGNKARVELVADMRYPGQAYEIGVPWQGDDINAESIRATVEEFHRRHEQQFAHAETETTPEVLTWRIRAIGTLENPPTTESKGLTADFERTERRVFVSSEWHTIPVVCRAHILEESAVGPLIVEDGQTTIFVPNDWTLTCLEDGTLRATRTTRD